MAPEQAARRNAEVGPAADVYALGAILYELLAGRPPFAGADALETIYHAITREPESLSAHRPGLSRDLTTVCHKCLEKDPARRYPSATALADDLDRFLAGRPVAARPLSGRERAVRWARRNPGWAAAVGLLAVTAVVSTGATGVLLRALGRAERAEGDLTARVGELDRETRARKEQLLRAHLATARAKRTGGRVGRRFGALAEIEKAAGLARELGYPPESLGELRDEAVACLALPDLEREHAWPVPAPDSSDVGFDSDLGRYAVTRPDGGVELFATGGRPIRRLSGSYRVARPVFSHDGRYLAAGLGTTPPKVAVWDLSDPRADPRTEFPAALPDGNPFHPSGRQFVLADGAQVVLYDLETGREAGGRITMTSQVHAVAFEPGGRWFAVLSGRIWDWYVDVIDVATSTSIKSGVLNPGLSPGCPAWSADGRLLAAGFGRSVWVWEFSHRTLLDRFQRNDSLRRLSVLGEHQGDAIRAWFLPDSGLLATTARDGVTRVWDPVAGKQVVEATGPLAGAARDGSHLVTIDGGVFAAWRVEPARECRILHHGLTGLRTTMLNAVGGVSFDPDGRVLATAGPDGVRFWDPAAGTEVGPPSPPHGGTCLFVPGSGALVTDQLDCHIWPRWPRGGGWEYGPPRPLTLLRDARAFARPAATPDGRWLGYVDRSRAVVMHTDDPTLRFSFDPHPGLAGLSLTPDGRLVAGGVRGRGEAVVWEVPSGRVVHKVEGLSVAAAFSPDGGRLATRELNGELRLWDSDGWRPVAARRDGNGQMAFSPNGRLLAAGVGAGVVRLLDARTLAPVVSLEAPHPTNDTALAIDPSGARLAVGTANQLTFVWDLRLLHRRLSRYGLGWGPFPPASPAAPPDQVTLRDAALFTDQVRLRRAERDRLGLELWANPFDAGAYYERGRLFLEGMQYEDAFRHFTAALALRPDRPAVVADRCHAAFEAGRWADVVADADRVLADRPDELDILEYRAKARLALGRHADAAADFRRLYAARPDAALLLLRADALAADGLLLDATACRVRAEAVARRQAADRPNLARERLILGIALYRNGRYQEAAGALERSWYPEAGGTSGPGSFFLALCHHELGRPAEARTAFRQAVEWVEANRRTTSAYQRHLYATYQAEAEAVLGTRTVPGSDR
jgi:WD40 repeat protein/tetratricopeptide (TPR) repeat protein